MKKYVGFTSKGYKNRFKKHLQESDGKRTRYLCKAIRKYGKDNFKTVLFTQDILRSHNLKH
ncbi:GIY-YIG nuclease family protein [Paenibacillus uliginis]|uniref:GIY-YIG nuclease family protein n=1 Tax=Paenibacillus uliginis TaxID=683737 RepID=UPI003CC802B0